MDISSLTPDKQVKLQYWLEVIRQCRASGLTNQAWCEQHNISLKSYYYWIAKIRKLALEDLLHIGTITVEVFEDISCELLSTILKAVQSC